MHFVIVVAVDHIVISLVRFQSELLITCATRKTIGVEIFVVYSDWLGENVLLTNNTFAFG